MIKKRLFKKERRSNNIPRNQDKNRTVNFFPLFFFLHIIPLYIIYFSSSPSSPSFVYRLVIVMIPLVFPFLLPRLLLCNNINEYTYMYASLHSALLYCDLETSPAYSLPVCSSLCFQFSKKKKSVCLFVCLFSVQVQRPFHFISLPCDSEVRFFSFPFLERMNSAMCWTNSAYVRGKREKRTGENDY